MRRVLTIKSIFYKGSPFALRFMVLVVLSVALMVVDANTSWLRSLRSAAGIVMTPVYWAGDLPVRFYVDLTQILGSRTEIITENEKLRAEALQMQRQLQKLALLTEQNLRLRELLNSSGQLEEQVVVAELLGVDPAPQAQRLLINRGERHGVYVGQPVLDARGVMGQVVEVMPFSARVLLITDATHSLPVQVHRNGLRTLVNGTGHPDQMELRYVTDIADIKEGDLLVTSGMGQRFPAGYPVATVTEIKRATGQPFANVRAVPVAALNRSRYFLLVFSEDRLPEQEQAPLELPDESVVEEEEAQAHEQD